MFSFVFNYLATVIYSERPNRSRIQPTDRIVAAVQQISPRQYHLATIIVVNVRRNACTAARGQHCGQCLRKIYTDGNKNK